MHDLRRTWNIIGSHFGCTQWNSNAAWVKWKLILFHLEIVLISAQDRCTIYAECTTGMQIVLDVLDGTLRDVGQGEARFSPFVDSVSLDAR